MKELFERDTDPFDAIFSLLDVRCTFNVLNPDIFENENDIFTDEVP